MKRTALLAILIGLLAGLVIAPSAFGIKAGFNVATKRLEAAYKIALFERRFSSDGCYPAPPQLAKAIHQSSHRKVGVAPNTKHLAHLNQVYVLKQGTTCEHLRMALRATGGIFVLDSKQGTVRLQGHKGAATPGLARPLTNLRLAEQDFQRQQARHGSSPADHLSRGEVPGRRRHDRQLRRRTRTERASTRIPTSASAPSGAGTSASSTSTRALAARSLEASPFRSCAGSA